MIILGIDSATTTGWALVERVGMAERLLGYGTAKLGENPAGAVSRLAAHVFELARPDLVVIEQPWMGKNVKTAMLLAEFVGRWKQAFESRGCVCSVVLPSQWRAGILTGLIGAKSPRAACKKAARIWGRGTFGVTMSEDEAEAVAVATWAARVRSHSTARTLAA